MNINKGDAIVTYGSKMIGIVSHVDLAQGLAWVIWPDRCGLGECQPIDHLQVICDRATITDALQMIAPTQQLSNPLERAFLNSARSQASTEIVEYNDDRIKPYYSPKDRRR